MQLPTFLQTDRLILRPHAEEDFEGFYRVITNEEATRFLRFREGERERAALELFYQDILESLYSAHPVFGLAIVEKGSRDYIGFCGLNEHPSGEGAEVYYVFHPDVWGKGYATEAAERLFDYAFSILELPRVDTFLLPGNEASLAVANKLGMQDLGLTEHREYEQPVHRFRLTYNEHFSGKGNGDA